MLDVRATQEIVMPNPPGLYRIHELYGEEWCDVEKPGVVGRQFKRSVNAGDIPRVCWRGTGRDGRQLYEVTASRQVRRAARVFPLRSANHA